MLHWSLTIMVTILRAMTMQSRTQMHRRIMEALLVTAPWTSAVCVPPAVLCPSPPH